MSNSKQTTGKPASEHAILKALAANPEATAAEVADAAGVGRSTASKVLARLASSGEVRRIDGGRDGARRLPDRFALASAEPAADDGKPKPAEDRRRLTSTSSRGSSTSSCSPTWRRTPTVALTGRPPSRRPWCGQAARSGTVSSG